VTELPYGSGKLPVGANPRDLAANRAHSIAIATSYNDQTLSVYSLLGGREQEIDTDNDPTTTSPGAATGITRIALPSAPRGVEILDTGAVAYGFVMLEQTDQVMVVDLSDFSTCKIVDVGQDSSRTEGPYDLVVMPDGSKGYLSFRGSITQPGDAVAVLDMAEMTDCDGIGWEVIEYLSDFGSDTGMGPLTLSPDASKLAVGGRRYMSLTGSFSYDIVAILDTASNTVIDVNIEGGTRFFRSALMPYSIAWSSDGQQVAYSSYSGAYGTHFSGYSTLRLGSLTAQTQSYDVALQSVIIGNSVLYGKDDKWVYVGDTAGGITALPVSLFEDHRLQPLVDDVGGCTDDGVTAQPCPATMSLGSKIWTMTRY